MCFLSWKFQGLLTSAGQNFISEIHTYIFSFAFKSMKIIFAVLVGVVSVIIFYCSFISPFNAYSLKSPVVGSLVLITDASTGYGKDLCRHFALLGYRVLAIVSTPQDGEHVREMGLTQVAVKVQPPIDGWSASILESLKQDTDSNIAVGGVIFHSFNDCQSYSCHNFKSFSSTKLSSSSSTNDNFWSSTNKSNTDLQTVPNMLHSLLLEYGPSSELLSSLLQQFNHTPLRILVILPTFKASTLSFISRCQLQTLFATMIAPWQWEVLSQPAMHSFSIIYQQKESEEGEEKEKRTHSPSKWHSWFHHVNRDKLSLIANCAHAFTAFYPRYVYGSLTGIMH